MLQAENYTVSTASDGEEALEVMDRKKGFLIGIDDYMVKPIDEEKMLLRIRALLRRAQIVSERKLTVGDVVLDYDSYTVTRGGNHGASAERVSSVV